MEAMIVLAPPLSSCKRRMQGRWAHPLLSISSLSIAYVTSEDDEGKVCMAILTGANKGKGNFDKTNERIVRTTVLTTCVMGEVCRGLERANEIRKDRDDVENQGQ